MRHEIITSRVEAYVSENETWNWPKHPSDRDRSSFITYIGGNNKQKLDKVIQSIPYPVKSVRRDAKRFKRRFTYELKIWGLAWDDLLEIACDLQEGKL